MKRKWTVETAEDYIEKAEYGKAPKRTNLLEC